MLKYGLDRNEYDSDLSRVRSQDRHSLSSSGKRMRHLITSLFIAACFGVLDCCERRSLQRPGRRNRHRHAAADRLRLLVARRSPCDHRRVAARYDHRAGAHPQKLHL